MTQPVPANDAGPQDGPVTAAQQWGSTMSGIMAKAKAGCRHAGQIITFLRGPRGPLDLGTAMALSNAGLQLIREMNAAGVQQVSWRFDDDMPASARLDAAERLNRSFQELQAAAHRHAPDRTPRRQRHRRAVH